MTDLRQWVIQSIEEGVENITKDEIISKRKGKPEDHEEYMSNKAMWTNLITDRILSGFVDFLPPPIDIQGKYEVDPDRGIHIRLSDKKTHEDDMKDGEQLVYLGNYSNDSGYNRYYSTLVQGLEDLYKVGERAL